MCSTSPTAAWNSTTASPSADFTGTIRARFMWGFATAFTTDPELFSRTAHAQCSIDVAGTNFTRAPAAVVEAERPFLVGVVPLGAAPNSRPAQANPALRMKAWLPRLRPNEDAQKLVNRGQAKTGAPAQRQISAVLASLAVGCVAAVIFLRPS